MTDIGVNRGLINHNIIVGKEVGKFSSKKEAMEAASVNEGSEVVYQKDNQWHVSELKEEGYIYNSSLSKDDKQNIELAAKKMGNIKDVTISFVEDDVKTEQKPKLADSTDSKFVLDKLAEEKPFSRALTNMGLMDNKIVKTKIKVAENPETSSATLSKLATEEYTAVKKAVAQNPNTDSATLEKLSKDESMIAQLVASNKKTPVNALKELSEKGNFSINAALAKNPNTPIEVLKKLSEDKSGFWQVKAGVAANPSTPKEILQELAKDNSQNHQMVKAELLHNPNTPVKLKRELAKSYDVQEAFKTLYKK